MGVVYSAWQAPVMQEEEAERLDFSTFVLRREEGKTSFPDRVSSMDVPQIGQWKYCKLFQIYSNYSPIIP
jgi:hypothetical protein